MTRVTSRGLRLAVAGGGTAGHVYPALAVVAAWKKLAGEGAEALYLGGKGSIEKDLVERAGTSFIGVESGPLRGKAPHVLARSAGRLAWGMGQAWLTLRGFKPHVLLATGGYASIPMALAAILQRIPLVLYLPDIEPGWAIRFMAPLARRIAVTSAAARAYLSSQKIVETGYPVREEIWGLQKAEARRCLGLQPGLPTVLVLGGSRGARSINRAVSEAMEMLLPFCQVMHISGAEDETWLRERLSSLDSSLSGRYALYPYLHSEFACALAAADLAVSRAGASVLGEYPAAGLPSILVPYPYAGSHQMKNAYFLSQSGAALIMRNGQIASIHLAIRELLQDQETLHRMSREARSLSRPQAARDIASMLIEVGNNRG